MSTKEQRRIWNITAYKKLRNNPEKWKKELYRHRKRFNKLGHKKFESICIVCGKKWPGVQKVRKFCSQKCLSSGFNNSRWNGGRYIGSNGYIFIWNPTKKNRREMEHRAVMELFLGRPLARHENVHHINEIKTDNRIENLKLMTTSEHSKFHYEKSK